MDLSSLFVLHVYRMLFFAPYRMYPMTQGVFRKIIRGTKYKGYEIPDEGLVQLNFAHGYLAESLYPEPEK